MATTAQATPPGVDRAALEQKVKEMYRLVAEDPHGDFHFEMGRGLAQRLGYEPRDLDSIPAAAIDSFAGVGYHFDLAALQPGEIVLDLGSGSGMDSFVAALKVGHSGRVLGLDMTDAQRLKAERLAAAAEIRNVAFHQGYIEAIPFDDASVDVAISNGVINLTAAKQRVFEEIARVLRPGGRLAISDIVTERPLPEKVVCDANLWAACIGGAMQQDDYRTAITAAGLRIRTVRENPQYGFLSQSAIGASRTYGVKSISLLATRD